MEPKHEPVALLVGRMEATHCRGSNPANLLHPSNLWRHHWITKCRGTAHLVHWIRQVQPSERFVPFASFCGSVRDGTLATEPNPLLPILCVSRASRIYVLATTQGIQRLFYYETTITELQMCKPLIIAGLYPPPSVSVSCSRSQRFWSYLHFRLQMTGEMRETLSVFVCLIILCREKVYKCNYSKKNTERLSSLLPNSMSQIVRKFPALMERAGS
jgi:hypothetical protein